MGDVRQSGSGAVLIDDGGRPTLPARPPGWSKIIYSVCSGALGTMVGAGASLLVPATARVAVWCTVAGAVCVGAGLMWSSGWVTAWREALCRWLAAASSS